MTHYAHIIIYIYADTRKHKLVSLLTNNLKSDPGKIIDIYRNVRRREQRMVCLMSEEELRIVDRYLEKYKITNKSRWLRETILMFIHKNMEEDYPTLFGEHDMRR